MKDQAFQITKGEGGKGIMVLSDPRVDITLRNEDTVAHEFVSPMLFNIPFRLSGNGTFVKLPKAAGVRVDPGQTVQLSFEVSQDVKEFQHLFEIFWCNVHGKQHGDKNARRDVDRRAAGRDRRRLDSRRNHLTPRGRDPWSRVWLRAYRT